MGNIIEVKNGDKYGRLTVIKEIDPIISVSGNKTRRVLCECECGNICEKNLYELTRKNNGIKSCGCLSREASSKNIMKYNLSIEADKNRRQKRPRNLERQRNLFSYDRIKNIFKGMKDRCYKETADSFKYYGAKGIKICNEWLNNFQNFYNWSIENGYADNLTIDRIDSNKDYQPDNCRWVTHQIQMNNTSRNHFIDSKNKDRHTIAEWARIFNIDYDKLYSRIRNKKYDYIEDYI